MKFRECARVIECVRIGTDIFSLRLAAGNIAAYAKPGQFVTVYSRDTALLLPRPISVCETDAAGGILRLVFRIAGDGTREFSCLKEGDCVMLAGPLGNGFPVDRALGRRVFVIGGGIGIPPMLELAKQISRREGTAQTRDMDGAGKMNTAKARDMDNPGKMDTAEARDMDNPGKMDTAEARDMGNPGKMDTAEARDMGNPRKMDTDVTAILGFRDELFLMEEFPCRAVAATEDGSFGTKGNVIDAIREHGLAADVIYACGPVPMLRALKQYALENGAECWLSMEEKMACGIGACLSCVCRSSGIDEHSQVKNKRVCTEGPVFLSTDIEL